MKSITQFVKFIDEGDCTKEDVQELLDALDFHAYNHNIYHDTYLLLRNKYEKLLEDMSNETK